MPPRLTPPAWLVATAVLATVLYTARVSREMVDFQVYQTAAVRALHGDPLYQAGDGHFVFKYLPAFALALAPLALVGEETAKAVWFACSVGLLVLLLRWSVAGLPERRLPPAALTGITLVCLAKFYAHELALGQANLLLGTLLVAALRAAQAGRPAAAGALVGLAAVVKPYALVMLPWLAVAGGPTAALGTIGVLALALLAPVATYGWSGNLELLGGWWQIVRESTAPNLTSSDNISFAAMWAKWLGEGALSGVLALATGALAAALAVVVWRRRRQVAAPAYLEWAFLMVLIPLLSPQGWDYVLLLATPAVVCLVDRWRAEGAGWRLFFAAALVVQGLTIFDLMGRELYGRFMELSIVTVAATAVLISLAHLRLRAAA